MTETSNCLLSARLHLLFLKHLPLWRGTVSSFRKTWNLLPMLCPNLVDIGPMVLEKIFKTINPISTLSWLFPLWRGTGPSIEKNNLKAYPQRIFCTKFGWNWAIAILEKKIKIVKCLRRRQKTVNKCPHEPLVKVS